MPARVIVEKEPEEELPKSNYFSSPKSTLEFIPSGCTMLDCILGGGWALGRTSNIVGNYSTGKTLLAIEATANFKRKFPKGEIFYREPEEAFDELYAEALGAPIDEINFGKDLDFDTVEDFFEDLEKQCDFLIKKKVPGLYILDSLDSLSDREELKRDIDKGTYGANKAKIMSQAFRRSNRKIKYANMHLMIISQVRDNIGVTFGSRDTRSGGRALDFYGSQVVKLSRIKTLTKQKKGVERPVGIRIRAKCTKNKVALPQREVEFEISFGYGTDELAASIEWLLEVNRLDILGIENS